MGKLLTRRQAWSALVAAVALGLSLVSGPDVRAQDEAPAGAQAHAPSVEAAFVTIDGEIDQLTERTFETRVARALETKPRFLVVSISSPGGLVESSRTIAWNLKNLEHTTVVAWIRGRALSGATFVAFGCGSIAMRPDGQLGDVMPIAVDMTGVLQPEVADDYVVATGETHSVEEFVAEAFSYLDLDWQQYVVQDPKFYRPAEVDLLVGDPSKAGRQLNWEPTVGFRELVRMMVDADMEALTSGGHIRR